MRGGSVQEVEVFEGEIIARWEQRKLILRK